MQATDIVDTLPLGALYVTTIAVVLISVEAGAFLGRYRRRRAENEKEAPIGAVVGAALGLLAFLLAFTFGMSASRFDTRKQMVLQESNAIGTTYLRAEMLPEPQRSADRNLLREYAQLRARGVTAIMTSEVMAESGAIQDRLWADAVTLGGQSPTSIVVGLYIQALNDMIDLDGERVTAGRNRIPESIWLALYLVTILTMAAMGYQFGLTGTRSWAVTILMVLVFASIFLLIADLDRPQSGFLKVSQQPMIDLINKIGAPAP